MFASLCAVALAPTQVPVDQPPRLRTVLPSGATILVERMPGARTLALGLFVSARATPETPATHGHRHLIEHIVALGSDGKLDMRLETAGGFMRARTFRDAMAFEFTLPPGRLQIGLDATADILRTQVASAELVRREVAVIRQEAALIDPVSQAAIDVWSKAYGERGLDSFGDTEVLAKANPARLEALRAEMFAPSNLVVVVVGDVDLDAATAMVRGILPAKVGKRAGPEPRLGTAEESQLQTDGGYLGVPVPGFRSPKTAATLAAAMAINSDLEQSVLIYTPSGSPGVVFLGSSEPGALDAALAAANPATLFTRGRDLARQWIRRQLVEPEDIVAIRGLLLCDSRDLRPETMLENLDTMTYPQFEAALNSFRSDRAIRSGGAR
jgi:predicted Zn-dependent peptidase